MRITPGAALVALTGITLSTFGSHRIAHAFPGNDTIATATPFLFSSSVIPNYAALGSQITSPTDVDFYSFQVNSAGLVSLGLTGFSSFSLPDPRIDLFDAGGTLIDGIAGRQLSDTLNPGSYFPRIRSG